MTQTLPSQAESFPEDPGINIDELEQLVTEDQAVQSSEQLTRETSSAREWLHDKAVKCGRNTLRAIPVIGFGLVTLHGATEPATIDTGMKGVTATARPILGDYSLVDLGPVDAGFPGMSRQFSIPLLPGRGFHIGARVTPTQTPKHLSGHDTQVAAAIGDDPKGVLTPMITHTLENQLLHSIENGAAAGVILQSLVFARRRDKQKQAVTQAELGKRRDTDDDVLQAYSELTSDERDALPSQFKQKLEKLIPKPAQKPERHKFLSRKRLAKAAGCLILPLAVAQLSVDALGTAENTIAAVHPDLGSQSVVIPTDPEQIHDPATQEVYNDYPQLRGAFVTGIVGPYTQELLTAAGNYAEGTLNYWRSQADYIVNTALPDFRIHSKLAEWQSDPNVKLVAQITDVHDNHPYLEEYLPEVLRAIGVDVIADTGDEENASGQSIFDNGAFQRLADAIIGIKARDGTQVQIVLGPGNHDDPTAKPAYHIMYKDKDGKQQHLYVVLTVNHPQATVQGMTFVGSADINRTGVHGTVPNDTPSRLKNDAKQGEQMAQVACSIFDKTKTQPLELGHEPWSTYASVARGCVLLAMSGHTHQTAPTIGVQTVHDSVSYVSYQQTISSASGDGPNNRMVLYGPPTISGELRVYAINIATNTLLGDFSVTEYPNSVPTITDNPLPTGDQLTAPDQNPTLTDYLDEYDPIKEAESATKAASRPNLVTR